MKPIIFTTTKRPEKDWGHKQNNMIMNQTFTAINALQVDVVDLIHVFNP